MGARTFFLHAGPPKTGSTTLQLFLKDNVDLLRQQGFLWPATGTELGAHNHRNAVRAFLPRNADIAMRQRLAAEIRAAGLPGRVLMSAEVFGNRLGEDGVLEALASFCDGLGYRLHVVLYIRPQAPLLNSLYAQNVRNWRPVAAIDAFLDEETASGRHHNAAYFARLLSGEVADFSFRPFNSATLSRGLVADFAQVIGLDLDGAAFHRPEAANASPGPMTIAAFQRLRRKVSRDFPGLDRVRLASLTRPIMGAAAARGWNDVKFGGLTPAHVCRLQETHGADNDRLALRVWGTSWSDMFTSADAEPPPYNAFDPARAMPAQRRAFRDFVDDSMEMIAAFAGGASLFTE